MNRLLLGLILIIIIAIFAGCIGSNTKPDEQVQSTQEGNGQISQTSTIGTGAQSSNKQGNVPDIYDIYGNKVNSNDIISVSKTPVQSGESLRLVREGLIDIEVVFNQLGMIGSPVEVRKVNKIPDPLKKQTFVRVRLFDDKGNIVMFSPSSKYDTNQEISDHPPDIMLTERGMGVVKGVESKYIAVKEWEFFIYFVDINKVPTPVPQKSINI